jgi:hypothetical protein
MGPSMTPSAIELPEVAKVGHGEAGRILEKKT